MSKSIFNLSIDGYIIFYEKFKCLFTTTFAISFLICMLAGMIYCLVYDKLPINIMADVLFFVLTYVILLPIRYNITCSKCKNCTLRDICKEVNVRKKAKLSAEYLNSVEDRNEVIDDEIQRLRRYISAVSQVDQTDIAKSEINNALREIEQYNKLIKKQ